MRDTNARTEHSKELRKETAKKRRERILDQGGLDFRALIEREHVEMLDALVEQASIRGGRHTKTSVFREMIKREYGLLKRNNNKSGLDQLDIVSDQIDQQPKPALLKDGKRVPPTKYQLNGQSWTGRGRKPLWVINYLSSGGQLEDIETDWRQGK